MVQCTMLRPSPNKTVSEELGLLGYNAVWSVGSQPTLRRNLSPSSSGSKNNLCKKPPWKQVASRLFLV
jgi:hypothetical protein